MIRIQHLRKAFGAREVLSGVDAHAAEGTVVAIVGRSGSGKSTLLRCLNGLLPFDAGALEIAGFALAPGGRTPRAELVRLRSCVGMVFQDLNLFPHLSVLENVTLAPRLVHKTQRAEAERRALELLELLGIAERARVRPHELSGGQKQRVAIARALAQGARVLLLDEPTSALDPSLRAEVAALLRRVSAGELSPNRQRLTLVVVTHDPEFARTLGAELWTLEDGVVVRAP